MHVFLSLDCKEARQLHSSGQVHCGENTKGAQEKQVIPKQLSPGGRRCPTKELCLGMGFKPTQISLQHPPLQRNPQVQGLEDEAGNLSAREGSQTKSCTEARESGLPKTQGSPSLNLLCKGLHLSPCSWAQQRS